MSSQYTPSDPSFSETLAVYATGDPADGDAMAVPLKRLLDNDVVTSSNLAEEYDATDTYNVGAIRKYQGVVYRCTTAVTVAEAFDVTKWTPETLGEAIENAGGGGAEDVGLSVVDGKVCITYEV